MSALRREGLVQDWQDRDIDAGAEWEAEIAAQLDSADIVLLLVSKDFLASDYCFGIELGRALEKHAKGEARVVPIIVRAVDWESAPFAKLQAVPTNARPVMTWSDRDTAWRDVVRSIRRLVVELSGPDHADSRQLGAAISQTNGAARKPGRGDSRTVGDGLTALTELMQTREVRITVGAFRADFAAAREQINAQGYLKDLHDRLHELQVRCYNTMVQEARRFPSDDTAVERLTDLYELDAGALVEQVSEIAAKYRIASDQHWVDDLSDASALLGTALQERDKSKLDKAVWRFNRVLSIQPAQINTRLNQTVHSLRLPGLIEALTSIQEKLPTSETHSGKVRRVEEGLTGLTTLNDTLAALVLEHDQWQAVDTELRRIEATISGGTTDLEMSWPDLRDLADPMYRERTDDKARAILAEADKLDSALAEQNPARTVQAFRRYRQLAGERFYRVDTALKNLCDELRQLVDPLAAIVEDLE